MAPCFPSATSQAPGCLPAQGLGYHPKHLMALSDKKAFHWDTQLPDTSAEDHFSKPGLHSQPGRPPRRHTGSPSPFPNPCRKELSVLPGWRSTPSGGNSALGPGSLPPKKVLVPDGKFGLKDTPFQNPRFDIYTTSEINAEKTSKCPAGREG